MKKFICLFTVLCACVISINAQSEFEILPDSTEFEFDFDPGIPTSNPDGDSGPQGDDMPSMTAEGFRTQTPGGWGAKARGNNPGMYLLKNWDAIGEIVVGAGENTLTFTSAEAIRDFLPSGGTPKALTSSQIDPTNLKNTLAGHMTALSISLSFDKAIESFSSADVKLGDMYFVDEESALNGKTVYELMKIGNDVLGGVSTEYSASEVTSAISKVNEAFVDGEAQEASRFFSTSFDSKSAEAFLIKG